MSRSSASENNASHAHKNVWLVGRQHLQPHHRVCPRYWLTTGLSSPFPSHLSSRSTREKCWAVEKTTFLEEGEQGGSALYDLRQGHPKTHHSRNRKEVTSNFR